MRNGITRIYVAELQRQCSYALQLIDQLNVRLTANNLSPEPIIRILDVFLGDVSRVSLLLWPERRGDQQRGAHLRKLLNISDDHPLRDRRVRNAFQHMDERLDRWAKSGRSTMIADFSTLPIGFVGGSLVGAENIARQYDPAKKILVHFGEEINIELVCISVRELLNRIDPVLTSLQED